MLPVLLSIDSDITRHPEVELRHITPSVSHDREEKANQAGLDVSALGTGNRGIGAVTEAFDERPTKDQVLAVVSPFIN